MTSGVPEWGSRVCVRLEGIQGWYELLSELQTWAGDLWDGGVGAAVDGHD